jgi:cell division protein FtsW
MACLVVVEPDLGTAMVICLTLGALLLVGGVSVRHLMILFASLAVLAFIAALLEPYRRARLTSFLDPWADAQGNGFQSVQAMIAIGSGGFFGVGLGESVQKLFYLPEAHTDMILAVIGEELGLAGMSIVLFFYGMIAYAGLRSARMAKDYYAKLVAAGITSVILIQATVNFFAVLGVLPLTGVPLPFISYGNSNLVVLLTGMGILINVSRQSAARPALRLVDGAGKAGIRKADANRGDRSGRDRRARRAGAGGRRRAAG